MFVNASYSSPPSSPPTQSRQDKHMAAPTKKPSNSNSSSHREVRGYTSTLSTWSEGFPITICRMTEATHRTGRRKNNATVATHTVILHSSVEAKGLQGWRVFAAVDRWLRGCTKEVLTQPVFSARPSSMRDLRWTFSKCVEIQGGYLDDSGEHLGSGRVLAIPMCQCKQFNGQRVDWTQTRETTLDWKAATFIESSLKHEKL